MIYRVSMDWDDVRYFLALSREGSVRAAGSILGVSHSTVARRVEALEEKLKVRLFDRTPEGYALTSGGRQMVEGAERVEAEMAALERHLLGQDESFHGLVRVTCANEYLSDMMLRDLAAYCAKYPGIDLAVTNSYRTFDLSKREADIAVRLLRIGKDPPGHLLGRKLARVYYAGYVAVDHAMRLDPEIVGEKSRWLGWGERKADEHWVSRSSYSKLSVWGSFGEITLHVQATRAGLGIAMLPCFVADRDPALRRLAQDDLAPYFDTWILSHPDLRDTARLRGARDYLAQTLLAETPLFQGERPLSVPE
jgi:DNA-binding transcriptional LysR family regulator